MRQNQPARLDKYHFQLTIFSWLFFILASVLIAEKWLPHNDFLFKAKDLIPQYLIDIFSEKEPEKQIQDDQSPQQLLFASENHRHLSRFYDKLSQLEKYNEQQSKEKIDEKEKLEPVKVRIMHFGDSLIWGDIITQKIRENFQADFGDGGRGLIPLTEFSLPRMVRNHRNTTPKNAFAAYEAKSGLGEDNRIGFTGETFLPYNQYQRSSHYTGENARPWSFIEVYLHGKNYPDNGEHLLEINLEAKNTTTGFEYNKAEQVTVKTGSCEKIGFSINREINAAQLSFKNVKGGYTYIDAINFERQAGVIYNSFSRHGTRFADLAEIPDDVLKCQSEQYKPDLMVFEYGINESQYIKDDHTHSAQDYKKHFLDTIEKYKRSVPQADILILGPPERELRGASGYYTMPQMLEVRQVQKESSEQADVAFLDVYLMMGGQGMAHKLRDQGIMQPDLYHFNRDGGYIVGDKIYTVLYNGYKQYTGHLEQLREQKEIERRRENDRAIQFNSRGFVWFIGLVLIFSSLLFIMPRGRVLFLLMASYYFYASWMVWPLALIAGSTIIDYSAGLLIDKNHKQNKTGRLWLVISLAANLGILFTFKYFDFFAEIYAAISGAEFKAVNLILPVGISFYTFQTMSYTIDVFRKKLKAEKNFIRFAFYVSFFPQLVAGPIVRAVDFLPRMGVSQIHFYPDIKRYSTGFFFIITGLTKKVLADYLAIRLVDPVFQAPQMYGAIEAITAVYAYGLQIYGDFSGYSDMAIGIAALLGFELPENFRRPYQALTLSDFWRRWHISLSTWLRDYLYIPLGGNRRHAQFNLFITMFLCGLWHGAGFAFIIWGVYHGVLLMIERIFKLNRLESKPGKWHKLLWPTTFHLILFGWLIFRSRSYEMFNGMLEAFTRFDVAAVNLHTGAVVVMVLLYLTHLSPLKLKQYISEVWISLPPVFKGAILAASTLIIYQFTIAEVRPFIYFQF